MFLALKLTDFAKIDTIFTTSEILYLTNDIMESEVDMLYKIILGVDFMKKVLAILISLAMVLITTVATISAQEVNKISPELSKVIENKLPDAYLDICIWTNGYQPNATEMPSWPDKGAARKELKEYYDNWYNNEIVPVLFNGIEYKEIFVGSGNIIVSVRVFDVEKIASYDIVREVEFFENRVAQDESVGIFEDEFVNRYFPDEYYEYEEIYYNYDENNELDWVLLYGYVYGPNPRNCYAVIDERVVLQGECSPFAVKYAIYDVEAQEFIDICDISDFSEYIGLEDKINELLLGVPLGDCDLDGELTILDATYIQMFLAGLREFSYDDELSDRYAVNTELNYISDIDRDGSRTILDATAIQMKLAKID